MSDWSKTIQSDEFKALSNDPKGRGKTCEPDVKALADKLWRVHPKEIQDLGITRQQYYEREIGTLISQLTAERDRQGDIAEACHAVMMQMTERAEAAEKRAKELEEDRDLDKVVLDEGIEIINELEASNKLLSERVAVLEAGLTRLASPEAFDVPRMANKEEQARMRYADDVLRRARTGLEGK